MYVTASKLLVVNYEGPRFLLVRSHRHWTLPGGKIEPDESPLSALKREIEEELGFKLDLKDVDLVGIYDAEGWANALFRMWDVDLPVIKIGREIIDLEWVDFKGFREKCPYWYEYIKSFNAFEKWTKEIRCPRCEGIFPRDMTSKFFGIRYCDKCYEYYRQKEVI